MNKPNNFKNYVNNKKIKCNSEEIELRRDYTTSPSYLRYIINFSDEEDTKAELDCNSIDN